MSKKETKKKILSLVEDAKVEGATAEESAEEVELLEPFVVQTISMQNEQRWHITENRIVSGSAPDGFIKFVGHVEVTGQDIHRGPFKIPVNFPLRVNTVEEAFLIFMQEAQTAAEAEKRRVEKMMLREKLQSGADAGLGKPSGEIWTGA